MRRRLLIPEVVQSSAMDCGPAALKALLEGFGLSVSYGRLREACQTDVDGTSIDSLEAVAVALGADAVQVILPVDHLPLAPANALPALLVYRLPSGLAHFVAAWGRIAGRMQIMDPGAGRLWPPVRTFLDRCFLHDHPVPAAAWRGWAETDEFLEPLRLRLGALGLRGTGAERLIHTALDDPGWRALGALDAGLRLATALADGRSLRRGEVARVLPRLVDEAREHGEERVPAIYWSVRERWDLTPEQAAEEPESVFLRGAVLVQIRGLREEPVATPRAGRSAAIDGKPGDDAETLDDGGIDDTAADLRAALADDAPSTRRTLLELMRRDGLATPVALAVGAATAAASAVLGALLLRATLDLEQLVSAPLARLGAVGTLIAFFVLTALLRRPLLDGTLRLGRHLELRLRAALFAKLPRLGDRYFSSRLVSDMAERGHALQRIGGLPGLLQALVESSLHLVFVVLGIVWLDPASALPAVVAGAVVLLLPLLIHPTLAERDLRLRSHAGALSRFYLDALLGQAPLRAHGAEHAMRREHEALLGEWWRAGADLLRANMIAQGVQSAIGFGLAIWLLTGHLGRAGVGGGVLLLVYWALRLPDLGNALAGTALQLPTMRTTTLRLLEPLTAPEETFSDRPAHKETAHEDEPAEEETETRAAGVGVDLHDVVVRAGGHTILDGVSLRLDPGEEVAVVGRSGAGKSTLVGLLLGWHRPASGTLEVDGRSIAEQLHTLRRRTAWVEPGVQLWNRTLLHNLRYGRELATGSGRPDAARPLADVLHDADLDDVLQRLPRGLRTRLGEGGALVSGGEGQRVRLGRALGAPRVDLAILDEPFRGLDRGTRRRLLERARTLWRGATLLCVTHDVTDTLDFPRVLVIDDGLLVEDGAPRELLARDGLYAALVRGEDAARRLWRAPGAGDPRPAEADDEAPAWRRLRVAAGQVDEASADDEEPTRNSST
ncbi:MAG: ATP-binding cassette domain-containing protein [Acidobacteriota bacterium]